MGCRDTGPIRARWSARGLMAMLGLASGLVIGLAATATPAQAREDAGAAFGVVEVGASGVRAVGYRITADDLHALNDVAAVGADARYELLERRRITDYTEADITPLLEENSERTADAVRAFVDDLRQSHAIAADDIYVVIDSGLGQRDHANALADIIHRRSGRQPHFITAAEQAALAFEWVTPVGRLDQAVLVDIGSSNITIAYRDAEGEVVGAEALPHGTKSFLNLIVDAYGGVPPADLDAALESVASSALAPQMRAAARLHRGLAERPRVYLAGGAPWALATIVRPQDAQDEWVRLAPSNFATFPRRARAQTVYRPDLSWIDNPDLQAGAEADVERVSHVFTRDQLLAASHLLMLVFDTLELHRRDAVFFARPARHGWQSQFLLNKARDTLDAGAPPQMARAGVVDQPVGRPVLVSQ